MYGVRLFCQVIKMSVTVLLKLVSYISHKYLSKDKRTIHTLNCALLLIGCYVKFFVVVLYILVLVSVNRSVYMFIMCTTRGDVTAVFCFCVLLQSHCHYSVVGIFSDVLSILTLLFCDSRTMITAGG